MAAEKDETPSPNQPEETQGHKACIKASCQSEEIPQGPSSLGVHPGGSDSFQRLVGGGGYIGRGPWDSAGRRGPTPAKRHFIKLGNMEALVGEMVSLFLA